MPTKLQRQISGQFGSRVPTNAVVLDPLDNGPNGHYWLDKEAYRLAAAKAFIAKKKAQQRAAKFEWDESKHPRDKDGKWTDAGGSDAINALEPKLRDQFLRAEKRLTDRKGANKNEQAVIVFPKFGYVSKTKGTETTVQFKEDEVNEMKNDGNAILTHNHPTEVFGDHASVVGLSPQDILAATESNLKEVRVVVDHPSGYYIFSMQRPEKGWPEREAITEFLNIDPTWEKTLNVARRYWNDQRPHDLTRKSVELGVSHARAKLIAAKFGMKYKFTKISDANIRA